MSQATKATVQPHILLVEDEENLALGILDNLELDGYTSSWAAGGEEALRALDEVQADLIILDVMLPGRDGLSVCRALRTRGWTTPVLFLSAKNSPDERVAGLQAGGDDYLGKPFHIAELSARIRAMLRRSQPLAAHPQKASAEPLRLAGCQVDCEQGTLIDLDGVLHRLDSREIALLAHLAEHRGKVIPRDELIEAVWRDEVYPATFELERIANKLRSRLEPHPARPQTLLTVAGLGLMLTEETS